jgi:hypothetical protein
MAPRTKAEPEAAAEPVEDDGAKSATIDDVKRVVHEAISEVFGNGDKPPEPEPDGSVLEPEPEKPLSDRERESRMEQLMGRAVATLLEKDAEAKAKPEKVEPETPPLQKIKRATRVVWGVTE